MLHHSEARIKQRKETMKILIYEPGTGGHRQVILSYVLASLASCGFSCIVITENLSSLGDELAALRKVARSEGCDVIHVLTADGRAKNWLWGWGRGNDIPVVVTYYLYSNLYGFLSGLVWDYLIISRGIRKILISDDGLDRSRLPFWRRKAMSYIPDPWNPEEFIVKNKVVACSQLGLRSDVLRFMVFGDLSARKGVDVLLRAIRDIPFMKCELLLVGRLSREFSELKWAKLINELTESGRVIIRDGYVPECDVGIYFSSCDYVMCTYPRWFSVSSGTFTRACAAGRPVISCDHGVIGHMVKGKKLGLVCRAECVKSLKSVITKAINEKNTSTFFDMEVAKSVADERTLSCFTASLIDCYKQL
jgi:glycosyltransferase involved in cell wall biosynthesis